MRYSLIADGTSKRCSAIFSVAAAPWNGRSGRLADPPGVDSWQALQLAYQLIAQRLGYVIEDGGKLYWPDSREPLTLSELIPHLHP